MTARKTSGTKATSTKQTSSTEKVAHPALATVPSIASSDIDALVTAVDTFAILLRASASDTTETDMRHLLRPRGNPVEVVPKVADLSRRYMVASLSYPVDVMVAQQDLVVVLAPVIERVGAMLKLVENTSFIAQSAAWSAAMVNYGLLKSEARGNALLRNALGPVKEQMRVTYKTPEGSNTVKRGRAAPKPQKSGAPSDAAAPAAEPAAAAPATEPTEPAPAAPAAKA
jgi:hypothetical protein